MSNKSLHKDIENWAVLLGGGVSLLVICNVVLLVVVCLLISGCGTSRKVERMQERQMRAEIGMVEEIPGRAGNDGEKISPRTSFGRNDNKGMPGRVGNDGRSPVGAGDDESRAGDDGRGHPVHCEE